MSDSKAAAEASSLQQPEHSHVCVVEGTPVYPTEPLATVSPGAGVYPPPPVAPSHIYPDISSSHAYEQHAPAAGAPPQQKYPYSSQPLAYPYPPHPELNFVQPTPGVSAPISIVAPVTVTTNTNTNTNTNTWEDNMCCGCEAQVCLHILGWVMLFVFGFGSLLWLIGACLPCCNPRLCRGQHRCGWVANLVMAVLSTVCVSILVFSLGMAGDGSATHLDD